MNIAELTISIITSQVQGLRKAIMMMSVFSQFARLGLLEPSVPDLIKPLLNLFFLVWRFDTLVDANV